MHQDVVDDLDGIYFVCFEGALTSGAIGTFEMIGISGVVGTSCMIGTFSATGMLGVVGGSGAV